MRQLVHLATPRGMAERLEESFRLGYSSHYEEGQYH
jgi:hypothetical protein